MKFFGMFSQHFAFDIFLLLLEILWQLNNNLKANIVHVIPLSYTIMKKSLSIEVKTGKKQDSINLSKRSLIIPNLSSSKDFTWEPLIVF